MKPKTSIVKLIAALTATLTLMCACHPIMQHVTAPLRDTAALVLHDSVYKAELRDPVTGEDLGSGTAFVVRQDDDGTTLMTAAHVCEPGVDMVLIGLDGHEYPATESKVNHDVAQPGAHDLCLLRSKVPGQPIEQTRLSPRYGEELTWAGAPLGLFGPDPVTGTGPSGGLLLVDGEVFQVFTAPLAAGASGSPVVNSWGELVGVLVASVGAMPGLVLCVPLSSINYFLPPNG